MWDRFTVAVLFVVLAAWFPYFEEIHSANELSRLYLAQAIVEDGTVSIDGPLKRLGNIGDKAIRDGRHYSDKAPGAAFWSVPVVWTYLTVSDAPTLRDEMRLSRLWVSTIPTAFLLLLMLAFLRERTGDVVLSRFLVSAYALGTLCTTYSVLLFGHQLSAVLIFAVFFHVRKVERATSPWRAAAIGLLAAAAVVTEYQNALFLLPLGVWFLVRARRAPRLIAWSLLGALPLALLLGYYHQAAFGGPLTTGYSFIANAQFKAVHEQGFMGIAGPQWKHVVLSFFSPAKGLFYYAPFLALAAVGAPLAARANTEGRMVLLLAAMVTLFVVSMVYPDGGWTVSQRHLTPAVPFFVVLVGLAVSRFRDLWPLLVGLGIVSLILTGLSTIVWPHYQEQLQNPFFQIGWPLFKTNFIAPSLFGVVGLSSKSAAWLVFGLACLGSACALVLSAPGRKRLVAWLLVAALLPVLWLTLIRNLHQGPEEAERVKNGDRDRAWIEKVYEK